MESYLSRLIGFTGYDGQGLAGIEYAYDEILQGTGDKIRLYTDAKGIPLPHVDDGFKTGEKGASVELTIDLRCRKLLNVKCCRRWRSMMLLKRLRLS